MLPVSSLDASALGNSVQVVLGRAGIFYGVSLRDAAGTDINIDFYDGTTTGDKLIWTGKFESTSENWLGITVPPGGISFTEGLFMDYDLVQADKITVYFG